MIAGYMKTKYMSDKESLTFETINDLDEDMKTVAALLDGIGIISMRIIF